jgi:hypothetical protein
MREQLKRMVDELAEVLIFECRQSKADQAEFEILVGDLRRAVHAATCAARVCYWNELNAKAEGEGCRTTSR